MKKISTFHSPSICYEIIEEDSFFHIKTYLKNSEDPHNPNHVSLIKNFSKSLETAELFTKAVSSAAALPIHMEELAEAFLSD